MADLDALKDNVKRALKLMTPEMQLDASRLFSMIEKHMPVIEKIGPQFMDILGNDVQAIMVEAAMGTVNKDALNTTLREAFAESGIVIPDDPNAGNRSAT
jgi:hypothetical protein